MTTTIQNEEDLTQFFDQIQADRERVNWSDHAEAEMGALEELHGGYFDVEASPSGNPWPAVSTRWAQHKGFSNILYWKGRLEASLAGDSVDSIREFVGTKGGYRVNFGTTVPYSNVHNEGVGSMPQREHIGLTEQYLDAAAERAVDHAINELARLGGV